MDLARTETQALVQKTARDFAERVVMPQAAAIDASAAIPAAVLDGLGDLGLMAVNVPAELGGAGAGAVAYALAVQEVARACASTAVAMSVTNMVGETIAHFGTAAQRGRYCPILAQGRQEPLGQDVYLVRSGLPPFDELHESRTGRARERDRRPVHR